jgi:hypothetical protein
MATSAKPGRRVSAPAPQKYSGLLSNYTTTDFAQSTMAFSDEWRPRFKRFEPQCRFDQFV